MQVEIKDKSIVITLPLETPHPSKTGKTLTVASTYGNKTTTATVNGKPVTVGVNAYISAN
jgi:hypothetical protein